MKVMAIRAWRSYYVLCYFSCREVPETRRLILLIDTGSTNTTLYAERLRIPRDVYESLEPGERYDVVGGVVMPRKLHDVNLAFRTVEGAPLVIRLRECNVLSVDMRTFEDGLLGMDVLDSFRKWGAERRNRNWTMTLEI